MKKDDIRGKSRGSADEPRVSDDAVVSATGHSREHWFKLLDEWGAATREHKAIAAWLVQEHGVGGWWAQNVTVDYEKARGLRQTGGRRDGTFEVSVSKTIAAPLDAVFDAVVEAGKRARWLPEGGLTERTSQPGRSARFDWEDGSTRVNFYFTAKGEGKTQISLQHERLPEASSADEMKQQWRDRLAALKELLEG